MLALTPQVLFCCKSTIMGCILLRFTHWSTIPPSTTTAPATNNYLLSYRYVPNGIATLKYCHPLSILITNPTVSHALVSWPLTSAVARGINTSIGICNEAPLQIRQLQHRWATQQFMQLFKSMLLRFAPLPHTLWWHDMRQRCSNVCKNTYVLRIVIW